MSWSLIQGVLPIVNRLDQENVKRRGPTRAAESFKNNNKKKINTNIRLLLQEHIHSVLDWIKKRWKWKSCYLPVNFLRSNIHRPPLKYSSLFFLSSCKFFYLFLSALWLSWPNQWSSLKVYRSSAVWNVCLRNLLFRRFLQLVPLSI
jgi:hypothetical protein